MPPVSLNPSTYVEGGFLDDVDVRVIEAAFAMFDYGGHTEDGKAKPTLYLNLQTGDGKTHDQYFSIGTEVDFAPSADGTTAAVTGPYLISLTGKALNNSCNAAKYLSSLVNAGYPGDKLDKADNMIGLEFHLSREAVKRTGLIRTGNKANSDRGQTVITCTKIHKLPWEPETKSIVGKGKPPAGAATAVPSSTPAVPNAATPASNGARVKAIEKATELLMENGGTLAKAKLGTLVFGALKGDPDQKAASQMLMSNDFYAGVPEFKFDGANVSLA